MSKLNLCLRAVIILSCISGAVYLLTHGNENGWGWLIFIAFCALWS